MLFKKIFAVYSDNHTKSINIDSEQIDSEQIDSDWLLKRVVYVFTAVFKRLCIPCACYIARTYEHFSVRKV
jgi:hypothetical protein